MATPKKKHLIELMIEANVKWPDNAEYATQDKSTYKVHFYKGGKPVRSKTNNEAWSDAVSACTWMGREISIELPSLCGNWHQTIVTREQYAEAMLMQIITGSDKQEQQTHSGEAGVIPSESIESLLTEIKAKREEHVELVAKAEALVIEIASIEQQVNDRLKGYGFSISSAAVPSEPEQPVITDWRDLRVGDVIECVLVHGVDGVESDESNNKFHGAECRVIGLTSTGINHIETDLEPDGYFIQEFKFIRRP